MSSLTSSRTNAAAMPCQRFPASKRSTMITVSTGTNATSWKSNTTAAMIGSDRA
jgi:hypothetical protein